MVRASATHPTAQLMEKAQAVKGRSLLADARRRLFRNKAAVASMALLALIALLALFAPFTSPYAFTDQDYSVDFLRAAMVARGNAAMPRRRRALVRHRCGRSRSLRAYALRRPRVAERRHRRHAGKPDHRRALRRDLRVHRRAHGCDHDAHRRHPLFAAVHLHGHHPDGHLQPELRAVVRRHRRRLMADDGADRARTDAVGEAEGVRRSRARGGRWSLWDHPAAYRAQRGWACDRLRHADDPGRHPRGELPVVPGSRHPRAVHVLGRADLRRRRPDRNRALGAHLPRRRSWR